MLTKPHNVTILMFPIKKFGLVVTEIITKHCWDQFFLEH